MARQKLPKLPPLIDRKLYKTGQTRGADDDVIYQNRVGRNSTVLIPYPCWDSCATPPSGDPSYEKGFIVLVSPTDYFSREELGDEMQQKGLTLGTNAVLFYGTRKQWNANNPDSLGLTPASSRTPPLGGQYVARVPSTTSQSTNKIVRGFSTSSMKGAGIRAYEYASKEVIADCRLQLEALFWYCRDSMEVVSANGMSAGDADHRRAAILSLCEEKELIELDRLAETRVVNASGTTTCPLCLEEISAEGFFNRLAQAEGREVPDLTVTQLNLFHIEELSYGTLGHRPYNLGWGHHHCNVVCRDVGIAHTLEWMQDVLERNGRQDHPIE